MDTEKNNTIYTAPSAEKRAGERKRRPLMVMFALLGVVAAAFGLLRAAERAIEFTEPSHTFDDPIDTLVVREFSYDYDEQETPCLVVTSPRAIARWQSAYRWTNAEAICCDEDTTHEIEALFEGETVRTQSCEDSPFSGYNNSGFVREQRRLVRRFRFSRNRRWMYTVESPVRTDLAGVVEALEKDEGFLTVNAPEAVEEAQPCVTADLWLLVSASDAALDEYAGECPLGDFAPDAPLQPVAEALERTGAVSTSPTVSGNQRGWQAADDTYTYERTLTVPLTRALTAEELAAVKASVPTEEESGVRVFANFEDGVRFRVIAPKRLGKAERARLAEKYGIAFTLDEAEDQGR